MPSNDVCDEIAAILYPVPRRGDVPDEVYSDVCMDAELERERTASELRVAWEMVDEVERPADPLLLSLARLDDERTAAEVSIRRLLAYGREFIRPKPYPLTELAEAAGMSFSGVRTAYDEDEVEFVTRQIGRRPRPAPVTEDRAGRRRSRAGRSSRAGESVVAPRRRRGAR